MVGCNAIKSDVDCKAVICNGSTMRGADGRTYSEHSRCPSYSRIELSLRTKYCAFWSGRTGGAMVEIYSLSRFVVEYLVVNRYTSREFDS